MMNEPAFNCGKQQLNAPIDHCGQRLHGCGLELLFAEVHDTPRLSPVGSRLSPQDGDHHPPRSAIPPAGEWGCGRNGIPDPEDDWARAGAIYPSSLCDLFVNTAAPSRRRFSDEVR